MRKIAIVTAAFAVTIALSACSKKAEEPAAPEATETVDTAAPAAETSAAAPEASADKMAAPAAETTAAPAGDPPANVGVEHTGGEKVGSGQ